MQKERLKIMEIMNIPTPTELRKEAITDIINKAIELMLHELRRTGESAYEIEKYKMTKELALTILNTIEKAFSEKGYPTYLHTYEKSCNSYGYVHVKLP